MALNRREFNKQETVRHIRSTFMSLYAESGIDGITVSSLCKACGIAKSTFYLYFDDKYQILEAVEDNVLYQLREVCNSFRACDFRSGDMSRPLESAHATVRCLTENGDTIRALMGKHGDPRFSYKWKKNIADAFRDSFRAEKGDNSSADIACTIFSSSLIGLYTLFLFDNPQMTERDLSIILINLARFSLYDFEAFAEDI
jgi:AcrR family transcriptional regulator